MANMIRIIPEHNKTVDVVRECDMVVIGGAGQWVLAWLLLQHKTERIQFQVE